MFIILYLCKLSNQEEFVTLTPVESDCKRSMSLSSISRLTTSSNGSEAWICFFCFEMCVFLISVCVLSARNIWRNNTGRKQHQHHLDGYIDSSSPLFGEKIDIFFYINIEKLKKKKKEMAAQVLHFYKLSQCILSFIDLYNFKFCFMC